MKRKVLALIRVSSDEQAGEDRTGIQRQVEDIERVVKANDLEVVRLYRLEGVSGPLVPISPEFREMAEHLSQPEIVGLVVAKLDRLMRTENVSDLAVFRHFERPKRLIWTNSGASIDITTFEGKLLISQQCLFAGKEKSDIIERAHRGKAANRNRADKAPDPLPKGVAFDRKTGRFSYTPDAGRVRLAFERLLEGNSVRSIAVELGYRHARSLRVVLDNPWWIGYRESKFRRGDRPPSTDGRLRDAPKVLRDDPIRVRTNLADAPLISDATWSAAQELLHKKKRTWRDSRAKGSRFELSGLLWCSCGERFYSKTKAQHSSGGHYYCSSQHKGGAGCGNRWFRRDEVDWTIARMVSERLTDPEAVKRVIMASRQQGSTNLLRKRVADAELQIERLEAEKARLVKLVRLGAADPDDPNIQREFLDIRNGLAAEQSLLAKAKLEVQTNQIADMTDLIRHLVKLFAKFECLTGPERKAALQKLMARIELDRNGEARLALRLCDSNIGSRVDRDSSPPRA